jgi:hypothetical protein
MSAFGPGYQGGGLGEAAGVTGSRFLLGKVMGSRPRKGPLLFAGSDRARTSMALAARRAGPAAPALLA